MPEPWATRAALAGLGLLSLAGYRLGLPRLGGHGLAIHEAYVVLSLGLFLVYLAAVTVVLRRPSADRVVLATILGFGLLFRLAVLPSPVFLSSDLYRYLWDGRVQLAGVNPYRSAPEAPELARLRDAEIHPRINRPTERTVYPPAAEAVFALVAAVAPNSVVGWRVVVLGCEGATVALLLGLLRRMRTAPSAVLVYAWAPLAVLEGVQAGHVDFVMFPLLLLALGWRQAGRMTGAGLALGLAILVKLYPAVLLLVWHRRGERRLPAACAGVVAAGYLAYLGGVGPRVAGFLPRYFGTAEDFNVGLRAFLTAPVDAALNASHWEALGRCGLRFLARFGYVDPRVPIEALLPADAEPPLRQALGMPSADVGTLLLVQVGHEVVRGVAMFVLLALLGAVLVRLGRRRSEGAAGVLAAGRGAVAAYLVLVPTAMHAWYAAWMLPFLTLQPSLAWLWFTGAVSLSYLKYAWGDLPVWLRLIEYLPLYGLLVWEWVAVVSTRWALHRGCGSGAAPV